jgi:predicted N-formylglutamate amidohydrolase
MLAIHDHVTRQMCDRLETTCIGLGLVRLLQDAKRFEEARTTLYALENGFQPAKPNHKPRKRTTRPASGSLRSARIYAA